MCVCVCVCVCGSILGDIMHVQWTKSYRDTTHALGTNLMGIETCTKDQSYGDTMGV